VSLSMTVTFLTSLADGNSLVVGAVCSDPSKTVAVPMAAYAENGSFENDRWTLVHVPLADICAARALWSLFVQDISGASSHRAAYIDDVQLLEGMFPPSLVTHVMLAPK
jgi:hypothetical protein